MATPSSRIALRVPFAALRPGIIDAALARRAPGDEIVIAVLRNDNYIELPLTLGVQPK